MTHAVPTRLLALLGLAVVGCGGKAASGSETGSSSGGETTSVAADSSTSATSAVDSTTTAAASTGAGGSSDEGMLPKLDIGAMPDVGGMTDEGCNKVDFLFVIDNSSSMAPHQANLVMNFPGFIDGIEGALDSVADYQVGVITTDAYAYNVAECQQLGSLVVRTGGDSSSNMTCGPYSEGYNFMTDADDLVQSFTCAAAVGAGGSGNEQPMLALTNAVTKLNGGDGQCNDNFLRDDSLLVIVYIGNENDNSPGTPMQYYQSVLDARFGIPENVVVMAITDPPGNPCGSGASIEFTTFTMLWGENGFVVPFCGGDYAPYFQEAIGIIDDACANYMPPTG